MFETVKSGVSILEVIAKDLEVSLKESGTHTYSIDREKEAGGCPFCGHKDCFKIRFDPEDYSTSKYHCFSCGVDGDVISWTSHRRSITPKEAAMALAKEYNIALSKDYNPVQEVMSLAATFYKTNLWESCNSPQVKLGGMTPLGYQKAVRKRDEETLSHFNIGWSDGNLTEFLTGLGVDHELMLESGLVSRKTNRDFLPRDCFIYPHYVGGRVSHFTFKDPTKKLAYQLPSKYTLNQHEFYNQDCVRKNDTILVVEGENDLASVWTQAKEKYGVIATIGSLSAGQLEWMSKNMRDKNVVTLFDPDEAGDKYRRGVESLRKFFKNLIHVYPPDDKDIDELISAGGDLEEIVNENQIKLEVDKYKPVKNINFDTPSEEPRASGVTVAELGLPTVVSSAIVVTPSVEVEGEGEAPTAAYNGSVFEKNGCYYKVKFVKDEVEEVRISNFIIKLNYIYVPDEGGRQREILIIRNDGFKSDPVLVSSDDKVNLKMFRTLVAGAADAFFSGTDADLIQMWDLVYSKTTEKVVKLVRVVGRNEKNKCWIFKNLMITDSGVEVTPDKAGIFWPSSNTFGIKPEEITEDSASTFSSIPSLVTTLSKDEVDELTKVFISKYGENLGNFDHALIMTAWAYSCAYSNTLFDIIGGMPMLYFWGSHGGGKSSLLNLLLRIYGVKDTNRITIAQIKTGVGLARKLSYYGSLPFFIDELRNDKATEEHVSTFRTYYDRVGRPMGDGRDSFAVKERPVLSCFLYSGEDQFQDGATRERCVAVKINKNGRGKEGSWPWLQSKLPVLSAIGHRWILESVAEDKVKFAEVWEDALQSMNKLLPNQSRKANTWAVISIFGNRLVDRYFPGYDFNKALAKYANDDMIEQQQNSTLDDFFDTVEILQNQEGIAKITNAHIYREGDRLHIWYKFVFDAVKQYKRGDMSFSKNAIQNAIREAPYFVSEKLKKRMGNGAGDERTVMTLDLRTAPENIRNIAHYEETPPAAVTVTKSTTTS